MKDEEMAKEWVDKEISLGISMYNPQIEYYCRQAFLAGLKAGKPQWHDLWKDKNDLPNNRRNVWITYINGYNQRETTKASFRYKYWVISGHRTGCEVIAWCEIPTFDKE